ncbi:lasso peptide biosynthesis B2 protein [Luteimonas sp. RD2P54]|uniref:Lasso peptide biosynthesis B2 protein n=1 Tax=Luteimonas endophytica TaxID=3042023 RepID=A0ABT6JCI2_9GAMM|nr:lasso peptide biosynthesis B2 protein [Luteimonas endophytica]MDH5823903.1 lasso peptide biosynthesis B2 protein [Luteimonas endophytica]
MKEGAPCAPSFVKTEMAVCLREHLYYCQAGGRVVLMDLERDSYFLLARDLESIFLAHAAGHETQQVDRQRLAALDLLPNAACERQLAVDCSVPPPARSATEEPASPGQIRAAVVIEVAWIVLSTKRRLATENIATVIDRYRLPPRRAAEPLTFGNTTADDKRLIDAAHDYAAARRFVPAKPSCLLDTLALRTFLARRRLTASIVFGVSPAPFAAHAWLQSGDLVLNETVSYARMHTPILVV